MRRCVTVITLLLASRSVAAGSCPPGTIEAGHPPLSRWCERGGQRHGPALFRYESGGTRIQGHYEADAKSGTWTFFTLGKKVRIRVGFAAGLRHGPYRYYHPGGALGISGQYVRGTADGQWSYFDAHGRKRVEAHYRHDLPVGTWRYWDPVSRRLTRKESYFSRGCRHVAAYDHRGRRTPGSGVLGGDRCRRLWKDRKPEEEAKHGGASPEPR